MSVQEDNRRERERERKENVKERRWQERGRGERGRSKRKEYVNMERRLRQRGDFKNFYIIDMRI